MVRGLAKLLLILTLACSIGLHWSFLQSIAWVGMMFKYSQGATVSEAMAKTFDGNHPCALCKAVAQGKTSEKKSDSVTPEKKFEFAYAGAVFVFSAPTAFWQVGQLDPRFDSLDHTPPSPPPKTALG